MFARIKSSVFIDSVVFEISDPASNPLRAILKDEKGSVCGSLEAHVPDGHKSYKWIGLNDLPYGVYTLEMIHGGEEHRQRMVKRV
jgi:hypothetical protein